MFTKRALDLLLAISLGILISPLLLAIALAVYVSCGMPVFFKQERLGRDEQTFVMWKFRTMTDARDDAGTLLDDAARLTRLGRILRRTSLDELPELLNVVKGEMSIVGPRPFPKKYGPYFTSRERSRFSVRPGITGLAQVSGRNDLSWDERFDFDVSYAQECNLFMDFKILCKTFWVSATSRGYHEIPEVHLENLDVARSHFTHTTEARHDFS